jgi:hypothetical protein
LVPKKFDGDDVFSMQMTLQAEIGFWMYVDPVGVRARHSLITGTT